MKDNVFERIKNVYSIQNFEYINRGSNYINKKINGELKYYLSNLASIN